MTQPSYGPACSATLICHQLDHAVDAWCQYLDHSVVESTVVSPQLAAQLGHQQLAGAALAVLANASGDAWLRIIEVPGAASAETITRQGWLSLEIVVDDVDQLAQQLAQAGSPFEVLRPAANLEMSDLIRACQVLGPCGEMLYLTEVKGAVPPFDLPRARSRVDRLFIPVVSVPDREAAIALYNAIGDGGVISTDTKITVVNQHFGLDLARQHPVAIKSLKGQCLIEIDQLAPSQPRGDALRCGVYAIGFATDDINRVDAQLFCAPQCDPSPVGGGRMAAALRGTGGEVIELFQTP